jgi:hypothetical protein
MSAEPPDNASTEPRISSTRNTVSLILLVISLIVGGIEVRAGLGQFFDDACSKQRVGEQRI